jgi:hypothetical protein
MAAVFQVDALMIEALHEELSIHPVIHLPTAISHRASGSSDSDQLLIPHFYDGFNIPVQLQFDRHHRSI